MRAPSPPPVCIDCGRDPLGPPDARCSHDVMREGSAARWELVEGRAMPGTRMQDDLAGLLLCVLVGAGAGYAAVALGREPHTAARVAGALALGLLATLCAIGAAVALHEVAHLWATRTWRVRSDDGARQGAAYASPSVVFSAWCERRERSSVTAAGVDPRLSSVDAAAAGCGVGDVLRAAVVGLLARGRLELSVARRASWRCDQPGDPPTRSDACTVEVSAGPSWSTQAGEPWLESLLLAWLAPTGEDPERRVVDARGLLEDVVADVVDELGLGDAPEAAGGRGPRAEAPYRARDDAASESDAARLRARILADERATQGVDARAELGRFRGAGDGAGARAGVVALVDDVARRLVDRRRFEPAIE